MPGRVVLAGVSVGSSSGEAVEMFRCMVRGMPERLISGLIFLPQTIENDERSLGEWKA